LLRRWKKKLLDIAQDTPQTVLLATDEASLYLQATLQRVWAPVGQTPIVRLSPSRDKLHFYGTLNLRTGTELVRRSPHMTAAATVLHWQQLLDHYPDLPILLLCDKAPWHQGPEIRALLAATPRLELLYFPTAAPELNPQEHLWKAVRSAVSHNHILKRLPDLAQQWESFLTTHTFPAAILDSLNFPALLELCTMSN
jgi:hypothetical protein